MGESLNLGEGSRFLGLMRRRFACKLFRKGTPIADEALEFLLECGRLSPTSFGLEPWKFVAVRSAAALEAVGEACLGQEAVSSSSLAVVVLVKREEAYREGSDFLRERSGRFPGGYPVFIEDYRGYHDFLEREDRVMAWARAQAYIACANMMTGATAIGLDSCAIEGYDEDKVLSALSEDKNRWAVGLLTVFGWADEEARPKIRQAMPEISKIV
jgi:nitroreductase